MILKVDGETLDFNDDVEVERQANLFEDISGTNGDFSYSFDILKTSKNLSLLGITSISLTPTYNLKKDAVLYSDQGEDLYQGYLRVESITDVITCSFFSGNNGWFEACDVNLREFNYSQFDKDFSYANVTTSFGLSTGIVWPLVDRGTLNERSTPTLYDNDFQPFIYVKDIVRTFLAQSGGIKLDGDILKDPLYNALMTSNNGLSGVQDVLDTVTVYAGKTSGQTISSTTYADVTFQDTTSDKFIEGSDNNWDGSSIYTVTKDIVTLEIEVNLLLSNSTSDLAQPYFKILVDSDTKWSGVTVVDNNASNSYNKTITISDIYAGSTIKFQAKRSGIGLVDSNYTIKTNSSIKFKPTKLRKVYAKQLTPDQNASDYLSSIFARFCVFASYNAKTKTINTKFLDNVARATEIDITPYVESVEKDFTSIVDDYSKSTRFVYQESGIDQVSEYNSVNDIPYGGGEIVIDNDFIEVQDDFLELEEVAPFQIAIPFLGFSLPYLGYCSTDVVDSERFSSVANSSGYARFKVSGTSILSVGDLVRVKDSSNSDYDGIYRVTTVASILGDDYIITDTCLYSTTANGTLELIAIAEETNEDQVMLLNLPNTALANFTDTPAIDWYRTSENSLTTFALGYFWLPSVNKPINSIGKALYFQAVNDPQAYQNGLIDSYFQTAQRVLNDPVVLNAVAYLPEKTFRAIDFLSPVRLVTSEFNSLFLVNRITGYKGRHKPCEMQLIKL